VQADEVWLVGLVVIAVLNTAVAAYYYLRWARTIMLDEPLDATPFQPRGALGSLLAVAAVGVLFFGIAPGYLIDAARAAADTLL
jgi:NADH:ubiquinone oxidoreductase subunit 2 (subunit N)